MCLNLEMIGNIGKTNNFIGGENLAKRPVFIVADEEPFYLEKNTEFKFHSGFAEVQKKKSIKSLHQAFLKDNHSSRILEISSKSDDELGVKLSAFNLMIETKKKINYTVEVVFQSSKVFQNGGPYRDMLEMTPKETKKDIRLKNSGRLKYFDLFGRKFELIPTTYFYNWLYINALNLNFDLADELMKFDSFTDIVFNPDKSINCQARAAAVYVSLRRKGLLEKALKDKDSFLEIVYGEKNKDNDIIEQMTIWDKF